MIFFEKCRLVPKSLKGDPFGFINIHSIAKYQETRRGTFWPFGDIKKFSEKSLTVPNKVQKENPLVSSGFVGYLEKVKNERGTLWTKFALAGLGLRWFQDCF